MGDVINYKLWAITQRIKELTKWIKYFPDSEKTIERRIELENLKKDLES